MSSEYTYTSIEYSETIQTIEFSSVEAAANLLIVCGDKKFYIQLVKFNEDDNDDKDSLKSVLSIEDVYNVFHGRAISGIIWSSKSVYNQHSKFIQFAVSTSDFKIILYQTDLIDNTSFQEVVQHSNYINGLAFKPNDSSVIASVSDDYTCKLYDIDKGEEISEIRLKSPGKSVNFHPGCPNQIMVAEEHGRLSFYDMHTNTAIWSMNVTGPLIGAHWCPSDITMVIASAPTLIYFWNIAMSSIPIDSRMNSMSQSISIRWSNVSSALYGIIGRDKGGVFCVYHRAHQKIPFTRKEADYKGLSWHYSVPLCATSSLSKLCLFLATV